MNIGLTGGIATGKSTVSALLAERGSLLVDADRIAREVVLPGSPVLEQIADQFGQAVLLQDGSLNRKALGQIVFQDPVKRKQLEAITHPAIRAIMLERMRQYERDNPDKLVVVDVPLLFESGLQSLFDEVAVVYAPRDIQRRRLMARDGLTEEEAEQRLSAQLDIERKRELADVVFDNSGSHEATVRQVEQYLQGKGLS